MLRDLENPIPQGEPLRLVLRDPDFTTAVRISQRINDLFPAAAKPVDAQTVECTIPEAFRGQPVDFISQIEQLPVVPDQAAKIVVDERTGAIVIVGTLPSERLQSPTGELQFAFPANLSFPNLSLSAAAQLRSSGMNSWSWRNREVRWCIFLLPRTWKSWFLPSTALGQGRGNSLLFYKP